LILWPSVTTLKNKRHYLNYYKRGMKGLPTAAPSFPSKMIIIIGDGIVYFLEVPKVGVSIGFTEPLRNPSATKIMTFLPLPFVSAMLTIP
ncbi:hypothetical protein, partial [Nostoc sp. LEGE 12447]|uniref:hypothetical protein n=1 Tax=Nostoc sp. LEGE 12447 TaxID=1828640 RepID=UPI001D1534DB